MYTSIPTLLALNTLLLAVTAAPAPEVARRVAVTAPPNNTVLSCSTADKDYVLYPFPAPYHTYYEYCTIAFGAACDTVVTFAASSGSGNPGNCRDACACVPAASVPWGWCPVMPPACTDSGCGWKSGDEEMTCKPGSQWKDCPCSPAPPAPPPDWFLHGGSHSGPPARIFPNCSDPACGAENRPRCAPDSQFPGSICKDGP